MEQKLGTLGRRQDASTQKLRLQVAERKMALLASYLLVWHCGRAGDIRHLVMNWDIRWVKSPDGKKRAVMDPAEFKTKWRPVFAMGLDKLAASWQFLDCNCKNWTETTTRTHISSNVVRQQPKDLGEDPGKILHPKVEMSFKDYLKRWRPILLRNLGPRAKYDVTFTDEKHGENASKCLTLFPGFWNDNQAATFVRRTFRPVLGCSERRVRKALAKVMDKHHGREWGVGEVAIHQQFHHSRDIHEKSYMRGLRNDVNEWQAWLLGWD
jgi:hypothetical protein